jgi:hypothetical protein
VKNLYRIAGNYVTYPEAQARRGIGETDLAIFYRVMDKISANISCVVSLTPYQSRYFGNIAPSRPHDGHARVRPVFIDTKNRYKYSEKL